MNLNNLNNIYIAHTKVYSLYLSWKQYKHKFRPKKFNNFWYDLVSRLTIALVYAHEFVKLSSPTSFFIFIRRQIILLKFGLLERVLKEKVSQCGEYIIPSKSLADLYFSKLPWLNCGTERFCSSLYPYLEIKPFTKKIRAPRR